MKNMNLKITLNDTAVAILMVVIGLLLVIFPGSTITTLIRIVAAIILVLGASMLIHYIMKKAGSRGTGTLITGIIIVALGLFGIIKPDVVVKFISTIAGIIIVLIGANNIVQAVSIRKNSHRWWIECIIGFLTVALGVLIVINPFTSQAVLFMVIGIIMIYEGVNKLILQIKKRKY